MDTFSIVSCEKDIISRVSSVLNKDVKQYGKKFMFDGNDETCWNSEQGKPQWVALELPKVHNISSFSIQFQGGFVGQTCFIEVSNKNSGESSTEPFYPEDNNTVQNFKLQKPREANFVKLVFQDSSDFFGRVIIYKLDLFAVK